MNILKQKDFTLLVIAKFISLMGTQMQSFALCLYVLKLTGSATKFASVLAMALIPQIILGPIAGVFVDWFNKKKLLVTLDILAAMVVGTFVITFELNGKLSIGLIYVMVMALSVISIIFIPTMSVTVPSIVKKEDLIKANSITSFVTSSCILLSPVLAGILFSFYGLLVIMIINSISFIVSSICEAFINIPILNREGIKFNINTFVTDFKEGLNFIRSKKIMGNLMFLVLIINFIVDSIISVGVPFISKQVIRISDLQYGVLQSIAMSSLILGPILCGILCRKFAKTKVLHSAVVIITIAIISMSVIFSSAMLKSFHGSTVPYLGIIIILFIINLMELICSIILVTLLQQLTPINIMGRVGALLDCVGTIAMPLGVLVYGILFDKISTGLCAGLSAIILIIIVIITKPILYDQTNNEVTSIDTVQLSNE